MRKNIPKDNKGVHRGALAGLSSEEREKAISKVMDEHLETLGLSRVEFIKSTAFSQSPVYSLAETLALYSKNELLEVARSFMLKGFSKLNKAELATMLAHDIQETGAGILEVILSESSPEYRGFIKNLADNKGVLSISVDELNDAVPAEKMPRMIEPSPPFINLFFEKGVFTYVLPKELLKAYNALDRGEIENSIAFREKILSSASYFTELCGIISLDDLYGWLLDNIIVDLEEYEYLNILLQASTLRDASFSIYHAEEDYGEYLVHYSLVEDIEEPKLNLSKEEKGAFEELRADLFERHKEITRKDFAVADVLNGNPYEHFLELPQTEALRALLDANVPDEENDYAFADHVLEELYDLVHWDLEPKGYIRFLEDCGLPFDLITSEGLLNATMDVINNMPHWANNGWTPTELFEQETGGRTPDFRDFKVLEGGLSGSPGGAAQTPLRVGKVGRNEPCPCGSGKKYKNCCGKT